MARRINPRTTASERLPDAPEPGPPPKIAPTHIPESVFANLARLVKQADWSTGRLRLCDLSYTQFEALYEALEARAS
jgi:hypothetical protein